MVSVAFSITKATSFRLVEPPLSSDVVVAFSITKTTSFGLVGPPLSSLVLEFSDALLCSSMCWSCGPPSLVIAFSIIVSTISSWAHTCGIGVSSSLALVAKGNSSSINLTSRETKAIPFSKLKSFHPFCPYG